MSQKRQNTQQQKNSHLAVVDIGDVAIESSDGDSVEIPLQMEVEGLHFGDGVSQLQIFQRRVASLLRYSQLKNLT